MRLTFRLNGYFSRQYLWTVRYGNDRATTLPLEIFTQRNFVADFIRLKLTLFQKTKKTLFEPPILDLGVTYALYLLLVGKPVVDFIFVIIKLFSLSLTAETL